MKTYLPNFGGWIASTEKDPYKLLHTIWIRAREDYTGLIGKSGIEENKLIFAGVQIRIKDKEPMSEDLGYPLAIEITDGRRIQKEFFDLWEYLKANNLVHGGPNEEDRKFFSDNGKRFEHLEILDFWVNKYYAKPSTPRMSAEAWFQKEGAPNYINYKAIQRRRNDIKRNSTDKKNVR